MVYLSRALFDVAKTFGASTTGALGGVITVSTFGAATGACTTGALGVGATTFGGVAALADVEITANTAPTAATWS